MYSKISIFTNESEYSQKRQNAKNEKIGNVFEKCRIYKWDEIWNHAKYIEIVIKID